MLMVFGERAKSLVEYLLLFLERLLKTLRWGVPTERRMPHCLVVIARMVVL
jgi:hypothetical protein